jgi:hypothetical protein
MAIFEQYSRLNRTPACKRMRRNANNEEGKQWLGRDAERGEVVAVE